MEITQFSPSDYFQEEAHSSGMHYVTEWKFIEEDDGTKVSINFSGTPSTFSSKLLNILFFFMTGPMKKAFLTDMDDLKKILER